MTDYKVRKNYRFKKEDAQIIGKELERLSKKHQGRITPEIVLKEATKNKNPLHKYFDWDNDRAAHQWRIQQTRYMIRSIEVQIGNEETVIVRKFYSLEDDEDGGEVTYIDVDVIKDSSLLRQQIIQRALKEIKYWQEKYKSYKEFDGICKEIDKLNL